MKLFKWLRLKRGVNASDIEYMHPALIMVTGYIAMFCAKHNILFVVSSILRSKEANDRLGAVSETHVQGRALDFSLRQEHGWTDELVQKLSDNLIRLNRADNMDEDIENPFKDIAAVSARDYSAKLLVVHDAGTGRHGHLQVFPNDWFQKKTEF